MKSTLRDTIVWPVIVLLLLQNGHRSVCLPGHNWPRGAVSVETFKERELSVETDLKGKGGKSQHRNERSEVDTILISYSFIKEAVTSPGAAAYIGCFTTSDQWSAETAHMTSSRGRKSGREPRLCIEDCWEQRLRFAVIGRGHNCLCAGLLAMMTRDEATLCNSPCTNNVSLACGGTTALDVYYTGYIEEPTYDVVAYDDIKKVFKGCYEDPYSALCPFSFTTTRLNVQMCMEYCSSNFFRFAAIDSPDKCCCTNSLKGAYESRPGKCPLLCATGRGKHETCGGDGKFMSLYITGATEIEGLKRIQPHFPWMRPHINDTIIMKIPSPSPQEQQ